MRGWDVEGIWRSECRFGKTREVLPPTLESLGFVKPREQFSAVP
jgi:hypothetical protein